MNNLTASLFLPHRLLPLLLALIMFQPMASAEEADVQEIAPQPKVIIASSGGATGALANSLPGIALANSLPIDYLELPLVATRDGAVLVHPSPLLGTGTDVATLFPDRAREDGHFYAIDFTLSEIRQLRKTPPSAALTPEPALGIATLEESLALLNHLRQPEQKTGIAVNLLYPQFHRKEGVDLSQLSLSLLAQYGFTQTRLMLQSADGDELQRLKKELLPALDLGGIIMQRLERLPSGETNLPSFTPYDSSWIFTRLGLRVVSTYADILALDMSLLQGQSGSQLPDTFLEDARALGLELYAFPLFQGPDNSQEAQSAYGMRAEHYLNTLAFNGIITSSPQATLDYFARKEEARAERERRENSILNINLQPLTLQERQGSSIRLHASPAP